MNYSAHYDALIARARNRTLCGYTERHHIVPKCMGGGDEANNIVSLTAEEHFVAHQLLVKMNPDNHRILWALSAMTNGTKRQGRSPNKRYGWLRRKFAKMLSERNTGKVVSEETRLKQSKAKLGKTRAPHSAETKAKMRASSVGRRKSDAHRAALSVARKGKRFQPASPARKQAISDRMKQIWAARKACSP